MLIDTHAHIYLEEFKNDLPEVIQRAKTIGIEKILLPNIDSTSIASLKQTCKEYPDICCPMMGLHPCSVKNETYKTELNTVEKELSSKNYIAVGEIGIDLYWDKSTLGIQKEAFAQQINWALELNLPFIIHARDAFDAIFDVMDTFDTNLMQGIFHCFTGDVSQRDKILTDYPNFLLGLGGVSTFKNSGQHLVIPEIPTDRMVFETDAPYLAPVPKRGKRNEPAYLEYISQHVADLKEMSREKLMAYTTENAQKLFNLN